MKTANEKIEDFMYDHCLWLLNLKNDISWKWYQFTRGIRNIIQWTPVIWGDEHFDWQYLAHVMEWKLRKMAVDIGDRGQHTGRDREARQMRICAELLKRLQTDDYWENAEIRYGTSPMRCKVSEAQAKYDQQYLGKMIGKHLRKWWD